MSPITLALMGLGSFLILLAAVGSIKFPDTLTRMAAVSKSSTLGSILFCMAAAWHFQKLSLAVILALASFIIFLGIPIASHLLVRIRVQRLDKNPILVGRNDMTDDALRDATDKRRDDIDRGI